MEKTPFELTKEQKGLLASLALKRGQPVPALIAEALQRLQEEEYPDQVHDDSTTAPPVPPSPSVLEIFQEAREGIPDEVWQTLPEDLAAQHDHYIYGTPKRTS